jgi:hypothetical protein
MTQIAPITKFCALSLGNDPVFIRYSSKLMSAVFPASFGLDTAEKEEKIAALSKTTVQPSSVKYLIHLMTCTQVHNQDSDYVRTHNGNTPPTMRNKIEAYVCPFY